MSADAVIVVEVLCVLVIAIGVGFIYWPASLIVGGGLTLLALQGVKPKVERE